MGRKKLAMCEPMLCCLFDLGYKADEIGDVFGASGETIRGRLRKYGRVYRRVICPATVVSLRLCGESMESIRDICGCKSTMTVWRVCKKYDLCDVGCGTTYDICEMRKLAESGVSASEIARRLGCTQTNVSKHLRKMGLNTSRDSINAERHAQAMDTISDRIASYFVGFDVVRRVDKYHYEVKCQTCGETYVRTANYKRVGDMGRCPECERRDRETAYWAAPKIQMQIHWPAVPYQTKDMDKKRVCQMCGGEFTEREWVERYGAAGSGRLHTTCSPECSDAKTKGKRKNVATIPWRKVARHYKTMSCALCGGLVDVNDYWFTNGYKVSGGSYPSTDHKIPIARGGDGSMTNSQLAHRSCNAEKGTMTMDEWKAYKRMEVSA